MEKYMVRLTDDTVGEMVVVGKADGGDGMPEIFDEITISLHDENGSPITATGQLAEILETL